MEGSIPDIVSYISNGTSVRNISTTWRDAIDINNRNIIEGMFRQYPDAETIHEAMIAAFDANDIPRIQSMIIDYRGFAPISWYKLISHAKSIEAAQLLKRKLSQNSPDLPRLSRIINDMKIAQAMISNETILDHPEKLAQANMMDYLSTLTQEEQDRVGAYLISYMRHLGDNINLSRYSIDTLYTLERISRWLVENGYVSSNSDIGSLQRRSQQELALKQRDIVPSDPEKFRTFLYNAAFNGRLDILDKYATNNNIIDLVVLSYDTDMQRIPRWMYSFLNYKSQEWNAPIDAWIANIIDDYDTERLPPPNLWRKILATAAGFSLQSEPAATLAWRLARKYDAELSARDREKLFQLSGKRINIR